MGGRIRFGSVRLAKDTRSAATGAAVGLGGTANDCVVNSVGACTTQLHRQAPGGQQSSCDGIVGGIGAAWSTTVAACVIDGIS